MIPSGGDEPSKTSQRTSRINFLVVRFVRDLEKYGTVHKFASDSEFSKQKSDVRAEKMAR